MPQAPDFWARPGLLSDLLLPIAWGHAGLSAARRALSRTTLVSVPVICVGNFVAGGAGKTPVVLSIAQMLSTAGHHPHILSRGYGGATVGPCRVDPTRHNATAVGDEPLLLAGAAPTWVGSDRVATAAAAIGAGADVLLLDDGFQNPALTYNFALLVVDGAYGLGNGRVIPAGPLREPAKAGLARAQAVIVMGNGESNLDFAGVRKLKAKLVAPDTADLRGKRVVAFAGIGRPQKFFATLEQLGATLVATRGYPDHHRYRAAELDQLAHDAASQNAALITTEKDWVRLDPLWRQRIAMLKVEVEWEDRAAIEALVASAMESARRGA
jgi:tetraacyldisaccharide 4'-kinase